MSRVVIGIHGLANKPRGPLLKRWWKHSIEEGLERHGRRPAPSVPFDMIYWARYLYRQPLHHDAAFDFDVLYNAEPYYEARRSDLKAYEEGWRDTIRKEAQKYGGRGLDWLKRTFDVGDLADYVLRRKLKDLHFYYDPSRRLKDDQGALQPACRVLQASLRQKILAHRHKEIMLIAHSMGTIISYDVLRDLGRSDPDVTVPYYVTIGSPLGLPHVKLHIEEHRDYDPLGQRVRTPSAVTRRWVNLADRRDPVAVDAHLADDYGPNARGVQVEDDLVANDYRRPRPGGGRPEGSRDPRGEPNPHKSYGYLRTPEVAGLVREFLCRTRTWAAPAAASGSRSTGARSRGRR